MLMPDVTEIIDDPEVGGGQSFQVRRVTNTRVMGGVNRSVEVIDCTGNVQPQNLSTQQSTAEDQKTESVVIYSRFAFTVGENAGEVSFAGPDEVLYNGKEYRITSVNDWAEWGFTIAYATRVMDKG